MSKSDTWASLELGEVCKLRGGSAFKPALQGRKNGEFPFIKVSDFNSPGNETRINGANNWVNAADSSTIQGQPFSASATVFAKIGEALKHNRKRLLTRPTYIDNNLMGAVAKPEIIHPEFLFQLFRTIDIAASDVGTAVPYVKASTLEKIPVVIPPLETQRRIASILGAYDDLIEVNRRRIAVLQEMARGLFEEWFVRFRFPGHETVPILDTPDGPLPEGWRWSTVKGLVQRVPVKTRYSQKTAYPEGLVPILDQGKSGIIGYHNEEPSVRADLEHPVIVFANHTCYQKVVHFSFSAIQNVLPFVPSKAAPNCVYWLHHATTGLVELNDYKGHWPEFLSKTVPVPPAELAEEFDRFAKPLHTASYNFQLQQEALAASRDLLLPRLISGQLSVAEAARELEEAA